MTREDIERFARAVKRYVGKQLMELNYEGMGEQDRDDFGRDFDKIINLALKGLEQEACTNALQEIRDEIADWHKTEPAQYVPNYDAYARCMAAIEKKMQEVQE